MRLSRKLLVATGVVAVTAGAVAGVLGSRPPAGTPQVQDATAHGYTVELSGYPEVLSPGTAYDGTVTVTFPADVPRAGDAAAVSIGVLGRGVPDSPAEGMEGAELDGVILCSAGVEDARTTTTHAFACRITAPQAGGTYPVTVDVVPAATGTTFETVAELTVAS